VRRRGYLEPFAGCSGRRRGFVAVTAAAVTAAAATTTASSGVRWESTEAPRANPRPLCLNPRASTTDIKSGNLPCPLTFFYPFSYFFSSFF
jgi:hypothetical protein